MVKNIAWKIEEKFSNISSKSCGPDCDFLGMKLSFVNNQVRVCVRECLRKAAIDFGEELTGEVTPVRNNLKSFDPKSPPADENKRKPSHIIVVLTMCISQRGRRNLQLDVSFLSKRVKVCAEEDHAKLRRFIRYEKENIEELLCLGASDLSVMINFIDAACGARDDCKSCTGAASTMVYGVLASTCAK